MGVNAGEIAEILRYRELLRNLVARDIKVRYKRSVIGFFWVMLNPLLMMIILNIVFSQLFQMATKNYVAYLLSGIIIWNFFSQSTSAALPSFLGNANLIKKIHLPKFVFPLAVVVSATVNFIFSLIPLFLILFLTGTPVGRNVYFLPLLIVITGCFAFGISLILSTLTVFFHDTIYMYEVGLLAWMYITPIFYPESIVPQQYSFIFRYNPFYYFISTFRGVAYLEVPLFFEKLLYASLCSVVALVAGWLFYNRFKDRVVYYL